MKSYKTVDEYILNAPNGGDILLILRDILRETKLTESIKWGSPVYTFDGKNIAGIGAFKSYVGLWFFQGALLDDKAGVLINAQEGTTKALRQWRFSSVDEINPKLIHEYVEEAIRNQKMGKTIKTDKNIPVNIPFELNEAFIQNKELESAFNQLTTGCKREFTDYISEAKKPETRKKRTEKIIPMIIMKKGLYDKYK